MRIFLLIFVFLVNSYAWADTSFLFQWHIPSLLGITTLLLLFLAVFSGWRRWQLKYHRLIAGLTVAFAVIHATIILLFL